MLNRVILYVKDIEQSVAFYAKHFGFRSVTDSNDRIVELRHANGGGIIMLHKASKGQKLGQSSIKLVFDVDDIEMFKVQCGKEGLMFGSTHQTNGYSFANAKDPCGNSIQVSSRAFKQL